MKQKIFKLIADLRFAIFILLLISLCSIIGTIIEQEQAIEVYKLQYPLNQKLFGILSWDKIIFFGFDHVYRTKWFFSLIIIFGFSLLTCTFLQQVPSIKIARRCQFFRRIKQFKKLKLSNIVINQNYNNIISRLKFENYSLFQQKNIFYGYKGLIGRIAPIIVHFSMIVILLGTLISSLGGFKAQEVIPKTENFHVQNIFSNGKLTKIPNISGRINDFWISYTKQKTVAQFYSDISILDNTGNEVKHKTTFVNSPIIYKNVYFYQTDWNLLGIRINFENTKFSEYPLILTSNNKTKLWLTWISNPRDKIEGLIGIVDNLQGYCSIYNNQGLFLGNLEVNEKISNQDELHLVEILSSTGLQIKADPGIPIIYSGFFFLMISTFISYITYSQIWIIEKNKRIFIGGNTTRAFSEFEIEFLNIIK